MLFPRHIVTIAGLFSFIAAPARAQKLGPPVACAGQRVSNVQVTTRPPYFPRNGKWWETPLGILTSIHTTTRPDVVRRFLLLQPGMRCDEGALAESERILRAQPFISDATIRTYGDDSGGVILAVETTDELTPIFGMGTSSRTPYLTALEMGEGNLMGTGRYVAARWGNGAFRDTYGLQLIDYQFLGRPWHLDLSAIRQDLGTGGWTADMSHPFFTDRQRLAWRVVAQERSDVYGFLNGNLPPVNVGLDRRFVDFGGITRIGPPGRLGLVGLSFSHEDDESGLPPLPDSAVSYSPLLGRFRTLRSARINALFGFRSIDFKRWTGFDALSAAQDVRIGFQVGGLIGRSLNAFGAGGNDLLAAGGLYAGAGGARLFGTFQGAVEGRDNYDTHAWDGIIGSAHLALYGRVSDFHTLVGTVDWAGGWRETIPFQLALGQVDGGVRGYIDSRDAGGVRGVTRVEDRWYVGQFRDQADLGLAFFADAGRVWAGDAPYGVTTPVKVGLGFGMLAAIPPGSKRTWRVDFEMPVSPDGHARWEIRFSTMNADRPYAHEPRDVQFSRERVVPSSVFNWP